MPSETKLQVKNNSPRNAVQSTRQLRQFQKLMATAVCRRLAPDDGMQKKWIDGRSMDRVSQEFVKPNERLTAFERLEIYNRQYWFRVIDCFHQDFPLLREVMGESRFQKIAEAYIQKYPSRSFTLRNLGSRLESFLRQNREVVEPHYELARDVVRFEWANITTFDELQKPALSSKELQCLNIKKTKIQLQPYVSILNLKYAVDEFQLSLHKKENQHAQASNAVEKPRTRKKTKRINVPEKKPTFLAIHRMNHTIFYKHFDPLAYPLLQRLKKGSTIADACETLLSHSKKNSSDAEIASKIQGWFRNWSSLGWFCLAE